MLSKSLPKLTLEIQTMQQLWDFYDVTIRKQEVDYEKWRRKFPSLWTHDARRHARIYVNLLKAQTQQKKELRAAGKHDDELLNVYKEILETWGKLLKLYEQCDQTFVD